MGKQEYVPHGQKVTYSLCPIGPTMVTQKDHWFWSLFLGINYLLPDIHTE